MIISVASGKGGTGKTTVAVSLALSLATMADLSGKPLLFVDTDVEEPNAHLFLRPTIENSEPFGLPIPHVDAARCKLSGQCADVCEFHAIAVLGKRVMVFPELCHGCGSCTLVCPEHAIHEEPNQIGVIESGPVPGRSMTFLRGVLNVGEASATPLIRAIKRRLPAGRTVIIDAPPGNSCPVVESMRKSNFVLLVTEPTPFGRHDLALAVQVAREEIGLPVGVVVNRDGIGDDSVDRFCRENDVPILLRIPMDRHIAEAYSNGIPLVEAEPAYKAQFIDLYRRIQQEVQQ